MTASFARGVGPAGGAEARAARDFQAPSLGVGTEASDYENRRTYEDYPPADDLWSAGIFGSVRYYSRDHLVGLLRPLRPAPEV